MRSIADALQSIAVTLWVGGMWAVGFIVAPVLFSRLGNAALAGAIAGKLLTVMAYIGMACAAYLLVYRAARFGFTCLKQGFVWVAAAMLALVLAGEFGVHAFMESLAAQALPQNIRQAVTERIREYLANELPAAARRKRFRREDWQKRPAA